MRGFSLFFLVCDQSALYHLEFGYALRQSFIALSVCGRSSLFRHHCSRSPTLAQQICLLFHHDLISTPPSLFAAHMFKKVSSVANAPLTISPKLKKARFFHQYTYCVSYLSNNLALSPNTVNGPAIPSSVLSSPVVCVYVHLCFYLLPLLRVIDNLSTHITISTSTSIAVALSPPTPLLIPPSCPVSLLIRIL